MACNSVRVILPVWESSVAVIFLSLLFWFMDLTMSCVNHRRAIRDQKDGKDCRKRQQLASFCFSIDPYR